MNRESRAVLKLFYDIYSQYPLLVQNTYVRSLISCETSELSQRENINPDIKNIVNYTMYFAPSEFVVIDDELILPYLTESVTTFTKHKQFTRKEFTEQHPEEDIIMKDINYEDKDGVLKEACLYNRNNIISKYCVVPEELRQCYKVNKQEFLYSFAFLYGKDLDIRMFIKKGNMFKYYQYFWIVNLIKMSKYAAEGRINLSNIYYNIKTLNPEVHFRSEESRKQFILFKENCNRLFPVYSNMDITVEKKDKFYIDIPPTYSDIQLQRKLEKELEFYLGDSYKDNKRVIMIKGEFYVPTLTTKQQLFVNTVLYKEKIISVVTIAGFVILGSSLF